MEAFSVKEARARFGELIDRARTGGTPSLVTRYGNAAAVVVSPEWYEAHRGAGDDPLPDDICVSIVTAV